MARKQIGEILLETGLLSPEDLEEALRRQKRQLGQILVDMGKLKPEDVEGALHVQSVSMPRAERYLRYLRITLVALALVVVLATGLLYQQVLHMRLRDELDSASLSVPRVLRFLDEGSPGERLDALRSVSKFSKLDEKAVVLRQALGNSHWTVRLVACVGIRAEKLKDLVPDLIPHVLDGDRTVRREVLRMLQKFTGENFGEDFPAWARWAKAKGYQVEEPKEFMKQGSAW
jgi:hypothetical protein